MIVKYQRYELINGPRRMPTQSMNAWTHSLTLESSVILKATLLLAAADTVTYDQMISKPLMEGGRNKGEMT